MYGLNNKGLGLSLNCLWLLTMSCTYQYVQQSVTLNVDTNERRSYASEPLTVELMNEFGISSGDLTDLQYFLGNALILQRSSLTGSSAVTSRGALDLRRDRRRSEIEIKHMTPGNFVDLQEDFQIFPPRRFYRILVLFEGSPAPLAFSPNFNGQYVLEKGFWDNNVKYDEFGYKSLNPQTENYLLINTRLVDNYTTSRKAVPQPEIPDARPAKRARSRGIY